MKTISRYIMTLALLLTAVTGAWATDPNAVTAAEINSDLYSGWSSIDGVLLKASDLPGFQAVTEDQAKSWAGVPSTGIVYLYYKFVADGHVKFVRFEDGVYEGSYEDDELERNLIWEDIVYNGDIRYFYTTGPAPTEPAITVEWNASTKTGTFSMPGSDVVLTPIYAKAAAFATTGTEPEVKTLLPEAAEGVIAGTDASLIAEGTGIVAFAGESTDVTQGTLMYAIGTSATEAPALTAFSATVPTAKDIADDGATVYVWYYIQGADAPDGEAATLDNTFDNTEPACLTVQVLTNKFDIQFNAANANTIETGKATVTVGGTDKTVTEGKLQGVKMGSEVKLKANTGYKFRKVEVKKGGAATLATALENGATVVIAFKYRDDGTCTFTNNNGTFTFVSGTGQLGGGNGPKQLSVENGKLIFKGSGTNSFTDRWSWYGFQVTFDPTANTYEVWKGSDLDVASFTSISVNGTDITDQLSELK